MILYNKWDIIIVPFPFTDFSTFKKRPAIVLSPEIYNQSKDLVIGFITSNINEELKYGDYLLSEWIKAGLPKPSVIRMKFATITQSIIIKKIRRLIQPDIINFQKQLIDFFK